MAAACTGGWQTGLEAWRETLTCCWGRVRLAAATAGGTVDPVPEFWRIAGCEVCLRWVRICLPTGCCGRRNAFEEPVADVWICGTQLMAFGMPWRSSEVRLAPLMWLMKVGWGSATPETWFVRGLASEWWRWCDAAEPETGPYKPDMAYTDGGRPTSMLDESPAWLAVSLLDTMLLVVITESGRLISRWWCWLASLEEQKISFQQIWIRLDLKFVNKDFFHSVSSLKYAEFSYSKFVYTNTWPGYWLLVYV